MPITKEKLITRHNDKGDRYNKIPLFFVLNPNHTKKLYHQLLKITTENYLIPQLKLCLDKTDEHTYYVYRYKRLFNKTENHFEEILNQISSKK